MIDEVRKVSDCFCEKLIAHNAKIPNFFKTKKLMGLTEFYIQFLENSPMKLVMAIVFMVVRR